MDDTVTRTERQRAQTIHRTVWSTALGLLLATALVACQGGPGSSEAETNDGGGESEANGAEAANDGEVDWDHVRQYWIARNEDPRYPESQYLTQMGQAAYTGPASYEEAEQNGRQRLAAFFETQIQSQFESYQEQITRAAGDVPPEVRGETFSRSSLRAIVDEAVPGADVTDRIVDPQEENAFVLVAIDRRTYADNLKVEIDELKSRIRSSLTQARTHRERGRFLGALRGYSPIVQWHQELVALIQKYNLVAPPGYPRIDADFDIDEVLEELVDVALRLTFAFKVEAEAYDVDGNPIDIPIDAEGELIRQLNDLGIRVMITRSTSAFREVSVSEIREMSVEEVRELLNAEVPVNYVVTGTLELRHTSTTEHRGQETLRYRGTYRVEVIELESNETIVLSDPRGRSQGGGQTETAAAQQTLLFACEQIAEELAESFASE